MRGYPQWIRQRWNHMHCLHVAVEVFLWSSALVQGSYAGCLTQDLAAEKVFTVRTPCEKKATNAVSWLEKSDLTELPTMRNLSGPLSWTMRRFRIESAHERRPTASSTMRAHDAFCVLLGRVGARTGGGKLVHPSHAWPTSLSVRFD